MANDKTLKSSDKQKKTIKRLSSRSKSTQTVRDRASSGGQKSTRRHLRKTVVKLKYPASIIAKFWPKKLRFKIPDNKLGKILRFFGRILWPKFIRNSFKEIRLVTWPNRRETIKLTMAVFIFSLVFATAIGLVDFGLSKAFEKFIVK